VFDYILPIYFMILYNTTGMSHLKVKGSALNKNARNVLVYHRVKIQNYISKFSQDISLSDNEILNSYLDV